MTPDRMFQLGEATWPPASAVPLGPWIIRDGQGGGSRVSAATATSPVRAEERVAAEQAMRTLVQTPLFMVRGGEDELDRMLGAAGYMIKDPVIGYAAPCVRLTHPQDITAHWPPLPEQVAIWAEGGIDAPRLAVMVRVRGPKTALLARVNDTPAAAGFVACDGDAAMIHALEVAPDFRRRGLGRRMLSAAADWAQRQGAQTLALFVTRANAGANALYASAGMEPVAQYHYRIHP